jgi:hypothetical protein
MSGASDVISADVRKGYIFVGILNSPSVRFIPLTNDIFKLNLVLEVYNGNYQISYSSLLNYVLFISIR